MTEQELICISGIGVVSSSGINLTENWEKMKKGLSGIHPVKRWDASGCASWNFGEVSHENSELIELLKQRPSSLKKLPMDRAEIMLFKALEEAIGDAGLNNSMLKDKICGLFLGTSLSCMTVLEKRYTDYIQTKKSINPKALLMYSTPTIQRLAYEYNITGPQYLFSTACSASLHTVIWACDYMSNNEIDMAIIGGTDPLSMISMVGFSSLKSIAKEACSPFSVKDPGISIGEGAGVLILEKYSSLAKRGHSENYAFIVGSHGNADAYHPTASDPRGTSIKLCIDKVLETVNDLESKNKYYVSHGTGTPHNDMVETRAIKQIPKIENKLKISSLKSMIGHTLGASGIIELALLSKSMKEKTLLPTINFTEPRPGCDLDIVKNNCEYDDIDIGIKSSFAFGGNNVSVALVKDFSIIIKQDNDSFLADEPIAITGMGIVSGFNTLSIEEIQKNILEKQSAIKSIPPLQGLSKKQSLNKAAIIDDAFIEKASLENRIKNYRKMDRISRIATLAAVNALNDSGLKINLKNAYDVGLISGSFIGAAGSVEAFYRDFLTKGIEYADAGLFTNTVSNAHAGYINQETRIKGYTTVLSQGLGSGIAAVNLGARALKSNRCKAVLVGSNNEYSEFFYRSLVELSLVADDVSYYDKNTCALLPGEGSAYLVLERLSNAESRNANIHSLINQCVVHGQGVLPQTFLYKENNLEKILESYCTKNNFSPQIALGDGYGNKAANCLEIDGLKNVFGNIDLSTFSDYFGYVYSANVIINMIMFSIFSKQGIIPPLLNSKEPLYENLVINEPIKKTYNKGVVTQVADGGVTGCIFMES